MDFLEKNLETIIFETNNNRLHDRGLDIFGVKKRQVRIGNYGIADIITLEKRYGILEDSGKIFHVLTIHVMELKKDKVDANAMMQAYRYLTGIKSYLRSRKLFLNTKVEYKISLIGKEICLGDFCYVLGKINGLTAYTYSYSFDGIEFDAKEGYNLINENF